MVSLGENFITVNVNVNGDKKTIKMEKGVNFENNSGIFTAGKDNKELKLNNYQWQALLAVANNYNEKSITENALSKTDIDIAISLYSKGKFKDDIYKSLPNGYKIEWTDRSKNTANDIGVQLHVAHNTIKDSKSTLKFFYYKNINYQKDKYGSGANVHYLVFDDNCNNIRIYDKEKRLKYNCIRKPGNQMVMESYETLHYDENGRYKKTTNGGFIPCSGHGNDVMNYKEEGYIRFGDIIVNH